MLVELRSKLIEAASYEEDAKRLRIFLTNGQLREFEDVPLHVVNELLTAPSAGTYYFQNIKGHYPQPD